MADPFASALDTIYTHSGVDVTVPFQPSGTGPLTVRGLYEDFRPESVPLGTQISEMLVGEPRAIYAFRRASLVDLPVGTIFEGPETPGGPTITWKVDSLLSKTALEIRVLVRGCGH